jgi:hypothetical protein
MGTGSGDRVGKGERRLSENSLPNAAYSGRRLRSKKVPASRVETVPNSATNARCRYPRF